jgi:lipoprotein-anchoring transpeptidase ErfK/SrfK
MLRKYILLLLAISWLSGMSPGMHVARAGAQKMFPSGNTLFGSTLPAIKPDSALATVPFFYGQVVTDIAPIYGSIDDARANKANKAKRTLPIGNRRLTYVTYVNEQIFDNKSFFDMGNGEWMSSLDVHHITPSPFQGFVFWRTPDRDFGWLLKPVTPVQTPGQEENKNTNGAPLTQNSVVQIYAKARVGDSDWYQIGPGQWVDDANIARVMINATPPQGVTNDRWIEVNLMEQTLSVYDKKRLVFATLISSGADGHWTRPGVFKITLKKESETMKLYDPTYVDNYLLEDVPWTMYFDEQRALHGAYWHNHFGMAGSRGCVNLSNGDAHWIFKWANNGEYVYVWDPSGKTPVDPAIYDQGGA